MEDAFKAIKRLTELICDLLRNTESLREYEMRLAWIKDFDDLRKGCEALRVGKRGSKYAQAIITRPEPEKFP